MAKTYDATGGTKLITGLTGKGMVKVGSGTEVPVWLQDWSLQTQFKTIDATPIGYSGEWKVQAGQNSSGSCKMNFRTDSKGQEDLVKMFFNVTIEETTPVVTVADNTPVVVWKFYTNATDYIEATIIIESANLALSSGNAMSFDVSFSVKGVPTYYTAP